MMASISPASSIRKLGPAFRDCAEFLCSGSVPFGPCWDVSSEVLSLFVGDRCGLLDIDCWVKLARLGSVILLLKVGIASCRVGVVGPWWPCVSLARLCSLLVGDPSKRYAKEIISLVYPSSLPQERDLFVPVEVLREDHPKLGILGAAELTTVCHCPEVRAGSCASSVLVAGVDRDRDCESVEPIETPESLLSSREDRLLFSPDDVREDMTDTHEFRRNA